MYDSPLREGDSFASYGSASRETDVDSSPKRGGDGDLGEIQTVTYTKRRSASDRKGKGRAVESTYRPDDIRIPVEADEVIQDEEDEEAEAKRIEAVRALLFAPRDDIADGECNRTSPGGPKPTRSGARRCGDRLVSFRPPSSHRRRFPARPTSFARRLLYFGQRARDEGRRAAPAGGLPRG